MRSCPSMNKHGSCWKETTRRPLGGSAQVTVGLLRTYSFKKGFHLPVIYQWHWVRNEGTSCFWLFLHFSNALHLKRLPNGALINGICDKKESKFMILFVDGYDSCNFALVMDGPLKHCVKTYSYSRFEYWFYVLLIFIIFKSKAIHKIHWTINMRAEVLRMIRFYQFICVVMGKILKVKLCLLSDRSQCKHI